MLTLPLSTLYAATTCALWQIELTSLNAKFTRDFHLDGQGTSEASVLIPLLLGVSFLLNLA